MAGTQVTSPNQVTRYERKNIWQIIGFISLLILIFAYKLGIDGFGKYIPFYSWEDEPPYTFRPYRDIVVSTHGENLVHFAARLLFSFKNYKRA